MNELFLIAAELACLPTRSMMRLESSLAYFGLDLFEGLIRTLDEHEPDEIEAADEKERFISELSMLSCSSIKHESSLTLLDLT